MGEDTQLSQERWEREFALKQRDMLLREKQAGFGHNPVFVGLLAATLALVANMYTACSQRQASEEQAHAKAQSDLILEAIKTGDQKAAAKNLVFLIHLGLLDDPGGKMQATLAHPEDVPVLPASPSLSRFGEGGYGAGPYGGKPKDPPDKN